MVIVTSYFSDVTCRWLLDAEFVHWYATTRGELAAGAGRDVWFTLERASSVKSKRKRAN